MTNPVESGGVQPLDLERIKKHLPPAGFWSLPYERTIHTLIAEVERLRAELAALQGSVASPQEPTPWTVDGSMPIPACLNDLIRRADVVTMWNNWRVSLPVDGPFRHSDGIAFLNKLNEIASAGSGATTPAPQEHA